MNKNFLSAILFGALMVTSTGTFVSCKDYDDDINELNTRVDGVESQIKDLEAKINAAKWITSVTPATGGFTVAFSDGSSYTITSGKDGAAGEPGAAGTEWTISDDGFWVCNGEKTTVKAVGQDGAQGEKGEDAQPEVKKENGKWYLWNGTEFEEFAGAATPATNVPYYYTDPNDANYTVLVICDKDGKNEKEIRLPMNEGLAEIMILDATRNMSISYYRYNGTAKWDGDKPLPAKGEYLITQPTKSFLIQVTPANYDLAALDLKLVNSKGEEAPVVLGEPVPYVDDLDVQSRAVSASGIFEVTVAPKDFNAETIKNWEDNFRYKGLSLVANESVRSTYSVSLQLSSVNSIPTITWGDIEWRTQSFYSEVSYKVDLNDGNEVTVTPKININPAIQKYYDGSRYVYDAFITMQTSSKADSIKNNVTTDGLKISANGACRLNAYVNYVNAKGQIFKEKPITINFVKGTVLPEVEDFALAAVTHQTSTDVTKQYQLADLSTYFAKYANDETSRILWNADASVVRGGIVEIEGTKTEDVIATWEHENEFGDIVTTNVTDLVSSIALCDKDGKNANNAEASHLKVIFVQNYGSTIEFEKGKVTVYATVQMKQADGTYAPAQTIAIPVTIKNPTATEIAKSYTFESEFFKDGVFTFIDTKVMDLATMVSSNINFTEAKVADADKNFIELTNSTVKMIGEAKLGVAYGIEGVTVNLMNRIFDVPSFKVKFVYSKDFSADMTKANVALISASEEATLQYVAKADKNTKTPYYTVVDALGNALAADKVTAIVVDETEKAFSSEYVKLTPSGNSMVISTKNLKKTTVDTTVNVPVIITVNGKSVKASFTVTVKAYPVQ